MSVALQDSPAEVIQWLLVACGLASDPAPWATSNGNAWPVFSTNEPGKPDNVVTVKDTAAKIDARLMPDGEMAQHWGFQVRIRSTDHPTGWAKAEAIRIKFNEAVRNWRITLPNAHVYLVEAIIGASTLVLGKDAPNTKRSLFTINAMVTLIKE